MQGLGPQEHLPAFMAGNEGDLLDGKPSFEEAACTLVPEVIKVKVFDDRGCIVASYVKQRNTLAVPAFPPRIFAISNEEHLFKWVEITPLNSADLVLAHCRRDREADDPPDGDLLKAIRLETSDQAIQLILSRSPVAFIRFADESQTRERNARQSNGLSRE
jgi:hypothetical protein